MKGARFLYRVPILKIFIPFVVGILLYDCLPWSLPWTLFASIFLMIGTLWLEILVKKNYRKKTRFVLGLNIAFLFVAVGYACRFVEDPLQKSDHFSKYDDDYLLAVVEKSKEKKSSYQQIEAKVLGTWKKYNYIKRSGLVRLSIKNSAVVHCGDSLIFKRYLLQKIAPKKFPFSFDFQSHYKKKGIHHHGFLELNKTALVRKNKRAIDSWHGQIRAYIETKIETSGLQRFGLAKAILLGEKEDLLTIEKDSFAASGTSHVLAVSGLHVGLIYFLFLGLLRPFFPNNSRWLVAVLLILVWTYALISSFAPSVKRASLMLSFVALGKVLNPKINVYNILFLSAMLILLFSPSELYSVGFQLSYSAVLGLVTFYPKLDRILTLQNPILKKIWSLLSISLVAQVSTLPIVLIYFHQFPSYFLIANLLVVPLLGLLLMVLTFFIFLLVLGFPEILLSTSNHLLDLFFFINQKIALLPGSLVFPIGFGIGHLALLLIVLILLGFWTHGFVKIKAPMLAFIVFLLFDIFFWYEQEKKSFFLDLDETQKVWISGHSAYISCNKTHQTNKELNNTLKEIQKKLSIQKIKCLEVK